MSTFFETINFNGSILFLIELMFRYAITRPFLFLILIFLKMSTVFNSQESVSGIFSSTVSWKYDSGLSFIVFLLMLFKLFKLLLLCISKLFLLSYISVESSLFNQNEYDLNF